MKSSEAPDVSLREFPCFDLVSASAGSGKTHALAMRYIALLLADDVPANALANILAITFTNNAAGEMRQRILLFLKKIALGDPGLLAQVTGLTRLSSAEARQRAHLLLDRMFEQFVEMQVQTIDSFLARVFKAAALELGFSPDFEILLDARPLVDYTFDLFARDVAEGSPQCRDLLHLAALITEGRPSQSFLWDPYTIIRDGVAQLMQRQAHVVAPLELRVTEPDVRLLEQELIRRARRLQELIAGHNLPVTALFAADLEIILAGEWRKMVARKRRTGNLTTKGSASQRAALTEHAGALEDEASGLYRTLLALLEAEARFYYHPFVEAHTVVRKTLNEAKRQTRQLLFEDINRQLVEYLATGAVPDIYLALGDRIAHYLIDEFQDTSPLQWAALRPLIENALSTGGSLFVVGDTKQSIYGFRGGDWRIMSDLARGREGFASVVPRVIPLDTNRRSDERIVRFVSDVFGALAGRGDEDAAAAIRSGLDACAQEVMPEHLGKGHVELFRFPAGDDQVPEREALLRLMGDLRHRGHTLEDIAVLTRSNEEVLQISGWLNGAGIPFLSHSSLDIRSRRLIGELLALLRFLDSPIDTLSFATFLFGTVFRAAAVAAGDGPAEEQLQLLASGSRVPDAPPLYRAFRDGFPAVWERLFASLFVGVGHLPLYDLVCEVYKIFAVFERFPGEESALVKLLEVVKEFEQEGENSLKLFLNFASEPPGENSTGWNIDPPSGGAVTLMTIHKAKGMQFPVVLLVLYDRREKFTTRFVDGHEGGVELVHITKAHMLWSPSLEQLRKLAEGGLLTDGMNMLYVALTRAERELYIFSVCDPGGTLFPGRVLPGAFAGEHPRPAAVATRTPGDRPRVVPLHDTTRVAAAPGAAWHIGHRATRRGEYIHLLLARMLTIDHPAVSVARAVAATPVPPRDREELSAALTTFLTGSGILPYFVARPGRRILVEQECVGPDGALWRIDRLVVDPAEVTVIDFKSGGEEREEEYREQVRWYMQLAADLFPGRRTHGVIAYVDLNTLRRVT
jgi:ATP-dependent helicase/nuclease subunit A